jgi:hypothetical protein
MKNFLPLVLNGEVTGFNLMDKEMVLDGQKAITYGHASLNHLRLVLNELRKEKLLVKHSLRNRKSVYLFDPSWEPTENTSVFLYRGRTVAFERGFFLHLFPQNGTTKPLIKFFTHRCFNNGYNESIPSSREVPYIALNNIECSDFVPTDEHIVRVSEKEVQTCFVPDKFNLRFGKQNKRTRLFWPFAEFVRTA